ncbi:MAG: site-specific DNA-methyltransferase [Actinomycetota bacterium]|nr:site-specific DNA-methyltransferase [Actinomycetota bacterium]
MSAPYWQDGSVQLYLGDCREISEWQSADVLVMDPPYGRDWHQGGLTGSRRPGNRKRPGGDHREGIKGDADTAVRDAVLAIWGDRPAVVFGDLMLAPPAGSKLPLVYQKPPDAGARGGLGGFRRDAEAVYLLGSWPTQLGGRSSILTTSARTSGNPGGLGARYGHPHAKPVDVMETLIAACPPGVIADPTSGAGSTLIAARRQGRPAIGVEVDERYCEAAARRLSQADMFGTAS